MSRTLIPIRVRPYTPDDRAAVRAIACETADRGAPVDPYIQDRALFADLVTRYYTDDEPQSLWVAEQGGVVVGYVTGCLDTRRYRRAMAWRVAPRALLSAIARGALWSCRSWRWVIAAVRTWRLGGLTRRVSLTRYPAHLHINIAQGFRRQRVGSLLVERFLAQACAAGVPGLHVAIRADNLPSCHFFERLGFLELSRRRVAVPNGASYDVHETVMYGKSL